MAERAWTLRACLCLLLLADLLQAAPRPPNIVFIFADDLGWTDLAGPHLGAYTSDYYQTPNLDALAASGMRFTNAYASAPLCSPTRASLLTGRYPATLQYTDLTGRVQNDYQKLISKLRPPPTRSLLPLEEVTIAERLGAAGYATAHIGKWHLGNSWTLPGQQGFDISHYLGGVQRQDTWDVHRIEGVTQLTLEFIEANRDNPFFVYLAHFVPHSPGSTRPDLQAKYEAKPVGQRHNHPSYAGMIEHMDESVGSILAKLDELGLTDNTLVVFTSDNGGNEGLTANDPLRGGKVQLYEGGLRVPAIFRLPGVIEPGSVSDVPITTPDFYPTLLQLASVPAAAPESVDGVSLVPVLEGTGTLQRDTLYWHYPHYAFTSGTSPTGVVRKGDWKLLEFYEDQRVELYNLAADLGEQEDLSSREPDIVRQLEGHLDAWRAAGDALMPKLNPNYGIVRSGRKVIWDSADPATTLDTTWLATIGSDQGAAWAHGRPGPDLGDLDADSQVDALDLARVLDYWNQPVAWVDPTFDGSIDALDLAVVLNHWGRRFTEKEIAPRLAATTTHLLAFPDSVYRFDGADDGMTTAGFVASGAGDRDDSVSFEIWFRLNRLDGGPQTLFETGGSEQGLSLTIGNGRAGDDDGQDDDIRLRLTGPGVAETITADLSQFTDPAADFVQVVAVVKDGSTRNAVRLYVNGARVGQVAVGQRDLNWDGADPAGLGRPNGQLGGGDGGGPRPFAGPLDGQIGLVRFYEKLLSDDEIMTHYNAALGPPDAHVTRTEGQIVIPETRPASLEANRQDDNATILLMHERQTTLDEDLAVDILATGSDRDFGVGVLARSDQGLIAAGTPINSYLLHFDPVGRSDEVLAATGSIAFDFPVLGLITGAEVLAKTDVSLGVIGLYPTTRSRQFELGGQDHLRLFDDDHSLAVTLSAMTDLDQLRVITAADLAAVPRWLVAPQAALPEPSGLGLMAAMGLWLARQRLRG